jgi:hypothetical protein
VTITDETRYHLHQKLEAMLGSDEAATLMEHLPPVGWADVATKRDLDQFALVSKQDLTLVATQLRLEMSNMRTELLGEIADLRAELLGEISGLDGKIADLRADLMGEISGLDGKIASSRTELMGAIGAQAAVTEHHLRNWVIASQAIVLSALGLLIQLH